MGILDTTKYTYWLFFKNLITGKSDSTVHAIIHVILLLQGYKTQKNYKLIIFLDISSAYFVDYNFITWTLKTIALKLLSLLLSFYFLLTCSLSIYLMDIKSLKTIKYILFGLYQQTIISMKVRYSNIFDSPLKLLKKLFLPV